MPPPTRRAGKDASSAANHAEEATTRDYPRRNLELDHQDIMDSPGRSKQVERDFAMVLAGMPHGRVPTTTDMAAASATVTSTTTTTTADNESPLGKRSPGKKHRPYRRTKRPKDYCG